MTENIYPFTRKIYIFVEFFLLVACNVGAGAGFVRFSLLGRSTKIVPSSDCFLFDMLEQRRTSC